MNEDHKQIDIRLEQLGHILRSQPSPTNRSLPRIERITPRRALWPSLGGPSIGLAACLAIGVGLLFSIMVSTPLTLADVQKSIDSKTWVLVRYEDGTEEWANLKERRSFLTRHDADGRNFYAGMRDHINGIWRYYHSNWGQQIHEDRFTPRPYPQTPWEYAVGDWDDRGLRPFAHTTVEKCTDMIGDLQVARFDTYDLGPSSLRCLAQQVWADPQTRLPLRIRKYPRPDSKRQANTGDFFFPESGPASIYDLGAPQGLPLVTNWGVIEPGAEAVIEAARKAWRGLPDRLRVVRKSTYGLSITYRWGDRLCSLSYGKANAENQGMLPVEVPEHIEDIGRWARDNLVLFSVTIFDGRYEYSYQSGNNPWQGRENPGAVLHVQGCTADWIDVLVPIRSQWPYVDNVGPLRVLEDEPGTPEGCILLRYHGLGLQRDWYIDPNRDYICVKQAEFRQAKDNGESTDTDGQWVERTGLTQLPSGQWYAKSVNHRSWKNGAIEFDATLLSEADLEELAETDDSTSLFDGERLLQQARAEGAQITFWAR